MKKKVIAMLLAVVMASSSIGTVPVIAAETTAQESVAVEEAAEEATTETVETNEDAPEGGSTEAGEDPVQDSTGSSEKSETETSEVTELTENAEEVVSADIADTSVEIAEAEEPAVVVEEVTTETGGKEARLADVGEVVDSGMCGENVTWILTGTGDDLTLTISGSGEMKDYEYMGYDVDQSYAPWNRYRGKSDLLYWKTD